MGPPLRVLGTSLWSTVVNEVLVLRLPSSSSYVTSWCNRKCHSGKGVSWIVLKTGEKLYEPQEPGTDDCCGKGCQECVWTQYWDSKRYYDDMVADMKGLKRSLTAFELLELKLEKRKNK
jgi:hypothetical protein